MDRHRRHRAGASVGRHGPAAFTRGGVNLRAGPGDDYPLVASSAPGQPLEVMGCTSGYGWCDVVLPDGLRGWVLCGEPRLRLPGAARAAGDLRRGHRRAARRPSRSAATGATTTATVPGTASRAGGAAGRRRRPGPGWRPPPPPRAGLASQPVAGLDSPHPPGFRPPPPPGFRPPPSPGYPAAAAAGVRPPCPGPCVRPAAARPARAAAGRAPAGRRVRQAAAVHGGAARRRGGGARWRWGRRMAVATAGRVTAATAAASGR